MEISKPSSKSEHTRQNYELGLENVGRMKVLYPFNNNGINSRLEQVTIPVLIKRERKCLV